MHLIWPCACLLVHPCSSCRPSCGGLLCCIDRPIALLYSPVFTLSCAAFLLLPLLLLLQPRTAKKLVLFVGQQDEATG
jgi:hypothetical protein